MLTINDTIIVYIISLYSSIVLLFTTKFPGKNRKNTKVPTARLNTDF